MWVREDESPTPNQEVPRYWRFVCAAPSVSSSMNIPNSGMYMAPCGFAGRIGLVSARPQPMPPRENAKPW